MKIAVNITPLKTGHKFRGIGYYVRNLIKEMEEDPEIELLQFFNLSEVNNVDVVHYPWFDLFFHTLPLKKRFPTVVTIHDVIPLIFPKQNPVGVRGKINLHLQNLSLRNCQYVITDSNISKKDIIRNLKINDDRIVVIPLAADSRFKILSDTQNLLVKRKYNLPNQFILFVGDANYVKNLPFLVEGFYRLTKREAFRNLKLVLVGGVFLKNVENIEHPELEGLKKTTKLIQDYKLNDQILMPGQVEDEELAVFYNLATVYVQPSLYEGFGLPVLEAFACGTPVISSSTGSLREIGGAAAIFFDPENINQFTSIAAETLLDRSLQDKLSKMGLKRSENYTWKKVLLNTKIVYEKAYKKK